jgi:N-acetylneuraminate synthase
MKREIKIGDKLVGDGHPTYVVAEIGINHNGDLNIAKELILAAKDAGVDAVKFQKRTPEVCVPKEQQSQMRETPWGYITYLEYRYKVEFNKEDYQEIDKLCKEIGIDWFVSVWDTNSVDVIEQFSPLCYNLPSASLTDHELLLKVRETGRPLILSTACRRLTRSMMPSKWLVWRISWSPMPPRLPM